MVFFFTSNVVEPSATIYMGRDKFENEDLIKHAWDIDVWFHVDKLSSAHLYLRQLGGYKVCAEPQGIEESCSPGSRKPASRRTAGESETKQVALTGPSSGTVDCNREYGSTWDDIPSTLLIDIAQLTKANSIEGNKVNNVTIIYTVRARIYHSTHLYGFFIQRFTVSSQHGKAVKQQLSFFYFCQPASNLKKAGDMDTGSVSFHNSKLVKRVHVPARANEIINRLNKTKKECDPDFALAKIEYEKGKRAANRTSTKKLQREQEAHAQGAMQERELRSYTSLFTADAMEAAASNTNKMDADDFM